MITLNLDVDDKELGKIKHVAAACVARGLNARQSSELARAFACVAALREGTLRNPTTNVRRVFLLSDAHALIKYREKHEKHFRLHVDNRLRLARDMAEAWMGETKL